MPRREVIYAENQKGTPRLRTRQDLERRVVRTSDTRYFTAVGDLAYTRPEDGIIVCPISALEP